jgi:hypothetical protein
MEWIYAYPIYERIGQKVLILLCILAGLCVVYAMQHFVLNIVDGSDNYHWFPKILLGAIFTLKIFIICYHVFWTDKVYIQKKYSQIDDLLIVRNCFPHLRTDEESWMLLTIEQRELMLSEITGALKFYSDAIEDLFILQIMLFMFGWFFMIDTNHYYFIIFYCIFSSFEFILSTIPTIWLTLFYCIQRKFYQPSL